MPVSSMNKRWVLTIVLLVSAATTGCKTTSWSMPTWPKWGSMGSSKADGLAVTRPSTIVPPANSVASTAKPSAGPAPTAGGSSAASGPYSGTMPGTMSSMASTSPVQPAGATMSGSGNASTASYAAPAAYPATSQAFTIPTQPAPHQPPATTAPAGGYQGGPYGSTGASAPASGNAAGTYAAAPPAAAAPQTRTTYGQPYSTAGQGSYTPSASAAPVGYEQLSGPASGNASQIPTTPAPTYGSAPSSYGAESYPSEVASPAVVPAAPATAARGSLPPTLLPSGNGYRPGSTGSAAAAASMATPATNNTYPTAPSTGGSIYR